MRLWERYFAGANFNEGGHDAGGTRGGGGTYGGGSAGSGGGAGSAGGGAGGWHGTVGGAGDAWYQPHLANPDEDTTAWLDGKKLGSICAEVRRPGRHALAPAT